MVLPIGVIVNWILFYFIIFELIRKYQQLHSNSVNLSVKTAHMVQLAKYDILLIVGVVVIRNRIDEKVKVEATPTI